MIRESQRNESGIALTEAEAVLKFETAWTNALN
jgi:hypothetical protein